MRKKFYHLYVDSREKISAAAFFNFKIHIDNFLCGVYNNYIAIIYGR